MSEPMIEVENLGKKYLIGHNLGGKINSGVTTLRESITDTAGWLKNQTISRLRGQKIANPAYQDFWALKDVSFEIQKEERIGIIGRNGAGKSTLLKILSRITEPTTGQITLNGRIASLLEVGTGFHPELTGRENIYLNGAILGMSKVEIKRKFDEIVAFSEVEKFLDTPVKRYSSGMYVRLAFAVAAHLEPEILVVDEVLAVGDAAFQKKCLGRMSEVSQEGRTVIFVSHNMIAVKSLCQRAIWLDDGQIKLDGESSQVVGEYLQSGVAKEGEKVWHNLETAPGDDIVRFHRISVRPKDGIFSDLISMQTPIIVEVEFWNLLPNATLNINLHFITEDRVIAFSTGSDVAPKWSSGPFPVGLFRSVCYVPGNFLNSGVHQISLKVIQNLTTTISYHKDMVAFEVIDVKAREEGYYGKGSGIVCPTLPWSTEYLNPLPGVSVEPNIFKTN